MTTVAIIPARGGSKSVPRKNLIDLHGHPLIAYTIDAARKCVCVDRVIVSTDDLEIHDYAIAYGSEVIMRPPELAQDLSRDHGLLLHILETDNHLSEEDDLVFLRPTHPIRNPETIYRAKLDFERNRNQYSSLRSMKRSQEIVFKTWAIGENRQAVPAFNKEITSVNDPANAPRQILPQTYYQDGYVEVLPFKTVTTFNNTSGEKVLPFIINEYSHDIDYLSDINQIAEYLSGPNLPDWFSFPKKK